MLGVEKMASVLTHSAVLGTSARNVGVATIASQLEHLAETQQREQWWGYQGRTAREQCGLGSIILFRVVLFAVGLV